MNSQVFKESYEQATRDLLALSINENTPYKTTLKFLDEQFEKYEIPALHRVNVLSNMLPAITTQFTIAAMQLALEITSKNLSFEVELENLKKQGVAMEANIEGIREQTKTTVLKNTEAQEQLADRNENLKLQNKLLQAQIDKLNKEQKLAQSQQEAVDQQVKDNRIIKAFGALLSHNAETLHGGLVLPEGLIKMPFDLIHQLIKKDISVSPPTSYTITKR
jgi:hypothetical protein